MTARRILSGGLRVGLLVALSVASLEAQLSPDKLAGRRLSDALLILQASGLHVVFSSELVTPDMRVRREPRAKTARDRLVELLDPHGLGTKEGPDETIIVVRKPRPRPDRATPPGEPLPPKAPEPATPQPEPSTEVYRTDVTVVADPPQDTDLLIGSSRRLDTNDLSRFGSHVGDDPIRTIQSLPGFATGVDYRSDLSIRGSQYRHASIVIEGTPAPWLQHAAIGRPDAGSLTMLRTDVVQGATLSVGAYARRDGSQLGPQVNVVLREGSRETMSWRPETSDSAATLTGEGPIGRAKRGSWMVGLRKSYTEWPLKRSDHDATVFGFGDLHSKVVYDARPDQQVSLSFVAGVSDIERDDPVESALNDGVNKAALLTAGLRSQVSGSTVVSQRASFQVHTFGNRDESYKVVSHGEERADAYRVDLTHAFGRNSLEGGVQLRRTHGSLPHGAPTPAVSEATWWERASYASFLWSPVRDLAVVSGVRLADSTFRRQRGVDRWVQVEWSRPRRWRAYGSAGVAHQFSALEQELAPGETHGIRPERAVYLDVGVGQQVTPSVRWSATVFGRRERGLRQSYPASASTLSGAFRGLDLLIERHGRGGLLGWAGYTFAVSRYTDASRNETFRADLDQRHVFALAGFRPIGRRTGVGLTFRAGSPAPIPGYFTLRGGGLYVDERGDLPNRVERPAYSRLDLRAERRFEIGARPVTAFAEVVNLLNHDNYGLTKGLILPDTGRAVGFMERQFSRFLTAGFRVEF